MAGNSRDFFQKYLESSIQYKLDIESITRRYEEEFKNGEDLGSVVDVKTLRVVKDKSGKLQNFHEVLRFGKSRKKNATSPANGQLKLDSNQNVTSVSEFETLKDISYCVASCIEGGESEPSDADTLSSMTSYSTCSEETDTSISDYKESPQISHHRHAASPEEHYSSDHDVLSGEDTSDELNGYNKEHQTERNVKILETPVMNETFTMDQTSRTPPRKVNACVEENPLRKVLTKFTPFDNLEIRQDENMSYLSNHDSSNRNCLSKSESQLVDSGFSTLHEGHSNSENEKSENVTILSVKNLKVFNESFTEKNSPLFNVTEMKSPEQVLKESVNKSVKIRNWISDVNHGKTIQCLQTNDREVQFDDFEHHLTPFSPAKSQNRLSIQSKYLLRSPEDELNRSIERQNNRQAMKPSKIVFDRPIIKKAFRRCNRQNIADAFHQLKTCNVGDMLMTDSHTIVTKKGHENTGLESRKMLNTGKRYLDEIDGAVTRSDNSTDFRLPNKYRKIQKKGRYKADRSFERETNSIGKVSAVQEDFFTSPKSQTHERIDATERRYSSSVIFTRKGLDDDQRSDIYEDDRHCKYDNRHGKVENRHSKDDNRQGKVYNRHSKDDLRHRYNKGYQPFPKKDEYNSDDSEVSSDVEGTSTNDYSYPREKPQHFFKAPIHDNQHRDYMYKTKPHQERGNDFQVDRNLPSHLRCNSPNKRDESSAYSNTPGQHIHKHGNLSVTPKSMSKKAAVLKGRDAPSETVHQYTHNFDSRRMYEDDEEQYVMGHPEYHIDNYNRNVYDEHQNDKHMQSFEKYGHGFTEHQTDKHVHRYAEHQSDKQSHKYSQHRNDKQGYRYDEQHNGKQNHRCEKTGNKNKNQGNPFENQVSTKDRHGDEDVKLRQTVGKLRKNRQHEEYKDKHEHQMCDQQPHSLETADMEDEFNASHDIYQTERRRNRQDRHESDLRLYQHHEKDSCNEHYMSNPNTEDKTNYFLSPNTLDKESGRQGQPHSHNNKIQQPTSQNFGYQTSGRNLLQTRSGLINDTDCEGMFQTHHDSHYSESSKLYRNSFEQSDEDAIQTGLSVYYTDAKDYDVDRFELEDSSCSNEELVIAKYKSGKTMNVSLTSRGLQEKQHNCDEQQHYKRSLLQSDKIAEKATVNRMYSSKSVTPSRVKHDEQFFQTDGKRTKDRDSGSVRKENKVIVSRRSCIPEFLSPNSHKHVEQTVNNHFGSPSVSHSMRPEVFSPSGSMARLKLSTPTSSRKEKTQEFMNVETPPLYKKQFSSRTDSRVEVTPRSNKIGTPTSSRKQQTQEFENVETPPWYKKQLSNRTDSRAELTPRSNKIGTPAGHVTGNDLSPAPHRRRRPIMFSDQNMSPVCSQGNFLNETDEVQTCSPELRSKVSEHGSIKQGAQGNAKREFDRYMNDVNQDSVGFISLDKLSKYTKQFKIKHGQFKDSHPNERVAENYTKALNGSHNDDISSVLDTYDINSNVKPYKNYYQKVVEKVVESDCEKENVRKILSNSKSNRTGHGMSQIDDPKMRKSLFPFKNPINQFDLTLTNGNRLHSPVPTESSMKFTAQVSGKDSKINTGQSQGHHYENSKQRHFRQSTPVKKGVLLQMNETMSTILGSEETDRCEDDEIILL